MEKSRTIADEMFAATAGNVGAATGFLGEIASRVYKNTREARMGLLRHVFEMFGLRSRKMQRGRILQYA